MAETFQVHFRLLQGFGFSAQLNTALHPWGEQQDDRDQQADAEPRQDRLVDRCRGLEQPEEIAESDFLFLILEEKARHNNSSVPTRMTRIMRVIFPSGSAAAAGSGDVCSEAS